MVQKPFRFRMILITGRYRPTYYSSKLHTHVGGLQQGCNSGIRGLSISDSTGSIEISWILTSLLISSTVVLYFGDVGSKRMCSLRSSSTSKRNGGSCFTKAFSQEKWKLCLLKWLTSLTSHRGMPSFTRGSSMRAAHKRKILWIEKMIYSTNTYLGQSEYDSVSCNFCSALLSRYSRSKRKAVDRLYSTILMKLIHRRSFYAVKTFHQSRRFRCVHWDLAKIVQNNWRASSLDFVQILTRQSHQRREYVESARNVVIDGVRIYSSRPPSNRWYPDASFPRRDFATSK